MKDDRYDFTTESGKNELIDDILREYQRAGNASDAGAGYSRVLADEYSLPEDSLPELDTDNFDSSDFSVLNSFTVDTDDELFDFSMTEDEASLGDRVDAFVDSFSTPELDAPSIDISPDLKDIFSTIPRQNPNELPALEVEELAADPEDMEEKLSYEDIFREYSEKLYEQRDEERELEAEDGLHETVQLDKPLSEHTEDADARDAEDFFASLKESVAEEIEAETQDNAEAENNKDAESNREADTLLMDRSVGGRGSMADEARKYIAGIFGGGGRRRRERKSLEQLQNELNEETRAAAEAEHLETEEKSAEALDGRIESNDEDQARAPEESEDEKSLLEAAEGLDFDSVFSSILAERKDASEQPEVASDEPEETQSEETQSEETQSEETQSEETQSEETPEGLADAPEETPAPRRKRSEYMPLAPDKLEESGTDEDKIIQPEYNKSEIVIDERFNIGGHDRRRGVRFGGNDVDLSADESYQQKEQSEESIAHWISGEEERVVDEELIGKRRISKRKQKELEREQMLRRQQISETQVAEDYDDVEAEPAEYAQADFDEADLHFNIDEDAFPPTFRAYLSSIIASAVLRVRGTSRTATNSTMADTDEELGAEVSPAAAYKYYGSFIPFQRLRLRIAGAVLILLCYLTIGLPVPGMLASTRVAASACLAMQLVIMLLTLDVFTGAVLNIFRLKFGADSLAAVSCIITAVDALILMLADSAAAHMPLCALSSFSLYGVALAAAMNTRALRKSIRVPAIGKFCYAVTGEMKFKEKQLTLLKSLRSAKGFVRRAEEMPPDETLFNKLSLPIFVLAILLSLILSVVHKNAADMVYIISAVLAPAVPFTALLSFALPYLIGANHIFKYGAAVAGWSGMCDIGTSRNLIITDRDIFPDSAVSIKEAKIFSDESAQRVISYAGTLVCASGSCISSCFAELMQENGCTMQTVNEFEYLSGGGMRALIDGHSVLCGSTDFMRLMNVRIPYRLTGKTAVLLAIDGIIYGIFTIEYKPLPQVRQALVELMRSSRHPVFAIRDFNVTPEMLHNCFDLATDGYDFPPYVERFKLSEASKHRDKDGKISAVICTEGLAPLTHAASAGRGMYVSVRINVVLSIIASLVSMLTAFFKLLIVGSAAPGFLLLLMAVWFIPVFIVSLFALRA